MQARRSPIAYFVTIVAMSRLYVDEALADNAQLALPDRAAHHVRAVLRLTVGDEVVLFDGHGGEYEARLIHVTKHSVRAEVRRFIDIDRESPLRVTLVQAISRGERMDYTLQKAVELGVACVLPVGSARSLIKLDVTRRRKRLAHWRGVVQHAAEQSGRTALPPVHDITDLSTAVASLAEQRTYLLQPGANAALSALAAPSASRVAVIAGPEGGFEPHEVDWLTRNGVLPATLGPRTLRTETAALTAIAVLQAQWGDFK